MEYIDYVILNMKVTDSYRDDAKQFIIMNLVKLYVKRFKYTDFYYVTKSVIRRKAIDFRKMESRWGKIVIHESQFRIPATGSDGEYPVSYLELVADQKAVRDYKDNNKDGSVEVIDYVRRIQTLIGDISDLGQDFTDWDREYMEVILELNEYGNSLEYSDIMECMGCKPNERNSFMANLNKLRSKIRRMIEDGKLDKWD